MRKVINIARAELRTLFYSPVAWFLLIAFMVQCAWAFMETYASTASWQEIYRKNNASLNEFGGLAGFTRILFLNPDGPFASMMRTLYLYIPLLTMGLIGREVQTGSIKLLYSSPVKLRQFVLGKYLAIMVYNALLVSVLGVFMLIAANSMIHVDYGMLLSAALGFFLLTCAYTAIGTFMSSITTYQIVAALSTFLVMFVLNSIGGLWQKYDFVRDLTYFLFLRGRTEKMLVGLLTTKDVIYFLVVIGLFLSFTLLRLRGAREIKPWYVKTGRYLAVIIAGLMIGYISSRPALTGYWDTTQMNSNTISENTQKLLKEIGNDSLEVTLYTNFLGKASGAGFPEARNAYLYGFWEPYLRFKPDMQFNYVYYYDYDSTIQGNSIYRYFPGKSLDHIAQKMAEAQEMELDHRWLKPATIRQMLDLRPEGLRLVMQLKYKGRTEFLRTFDDTGLWPQEGHVATVLRRLLYQDAPQVGFITGHYERSIYKSGEREYRKTTAGKEERGSMINNGFDVDTISLDHHDIPAGISALVLADPKAALSDTCLQKISNYLDKGGNMYILGEPGKQIITNPVLKPLGLQFMDGIMVMPTKDETPDKLSAHITNDGLSLGADPASAAFKKAKDKHEHMLMEGSVPIAVSDSTLFAIKTLVSTAGSEAYSWLKKGKLINDSATVFFNEAEGDRRGTFPMMMALHRKINNKEQRIVVAGDADFMRNDRNPQISGSYSWITYGKYPVRIPRITQPDQQLTVSGKRAELLKTIFVWIIPAFLTLAGAILLIRRKRK